VKLSGLRVIVSVLKAGFPSMDSARCRIWGVPPSIQNQVSTLGVIFPNTRQNNAMVIEAGDDKGGMSVVYAGNLNNVWRDMEDMPETSLNLEGLAGKYAALFPTTAASYPGSADVSVIMADIAAKNDWAFENNGVHVILNNAYFPGSGLEQAHAAARAAGIQMYLDSSTSPNLLTIWPEYGSRTGTIPLISPASGLIGYPKWRDLGMQFKTLYNPAIRMNGLIKMESSLGREGMPDTGQGKGTAEAPGGPNGEWVVTFPLVIDLSAELPNGPWFSEVTCTRVNGPGAAR